MPREHSTQDSTKAPPTDISAPKDAVLESYLTVHEPGSSGGEFRISWVFGLTLAGQAEDDTAVGSFSQKPLELLLLRPDTNASHVWRVPHDSKPWQSLWFLLNPAPPWLANSRLPEIRPGIFKLSLKGTSVADKVYEALLAAHQVLHSRWPNRHELAMNSIERAFLWAHAVITEQSQRSDPRIARALDYLMQHLFEPLRMKDLTACAALSPSRFLELFRNETGTTPQVYWERERIRHAQSLLIHTEKPVKEISWMLGYKQTSYFARRFRQHTGVSPARYREQTRAERLELDSVDGGRTEARH